MMKLHFSCKHFFALHGSNPLIFIRSAAVLFSIFSIFSIFLSPVKVYGLDSAGLDSLEQEILQTKDVSLLNYLIGKFDPSEMQELQIVQRPFASRPMYLRKDVFAAYKRMRNSAKRNGVDLVIVSAFRSYLEQKRIWDKKYRLSTLLEQSDEKRIEYVLRYSAPPGFSRHHWGTDIDLNALSNDYFYKGEGKKVAHWLDKHAEEFGFFRVYTRNRRGGHLHEDWHYTYYPVSSKYMLLYMVHVKPAHVDNFQGSQSLDVNQFFLEYVYNISENILSRMSIEGLLEP